MSALHRHHQRRPLPQVLVFATLATWTVVGCASTQTGGTQWPHFKRAKRIGGGEADSAVIVGLERYAAVPSIRGARSNANDWHDYLRDGLGVPEDRIELLVDSDATRERMAQAAVRAAKRTASKGRLWFIFIGHGAPSVDGKDGLLVGWDAQQTADSLATRSLAQGQLLASLQKSKAKQVRVVLDACFSGRVDGRTALVPGLQPLVVTRISGPRDPRTILFTAAKSNQFAGPLAGAGRPAFSYLLLGALRGWADEDQDGQITAREALSFSSSALRLTSAGRVQQPTLVAKKKNVVLDRSLGERPPPLGQQGFGRDLGELPVISEVPVKNRIVAVPKGLKDTDIKRRRLLSRARKASRNRQMPYVLRAVAWRDFARYRGALEIIPDAAQQRNVWLSRNREVCARRRKIEEVRRRRAADAAKLKQLLGLDADGATPAERRQWQEEFDTAYGPWRKALNEPKDKLARCSLADSAVALIKVSGPHANSVAEAVKVAITNLDARRFITPKQWASAGRSVGLTRDTAYHRQRLAHHLGVDRLLVATTKTWPTENKKGRYHFVDIKAYEMDGKTLLAEWSGKTTREAIITRQVAKRLDRHLRGAFDLMIR